jgi:hypothetical protein
MVLFGKRLTLPCLFRVVVLYYNFAKRDQVMPALDTERRTATRSALRYRPIDTDQTHAGPVVSRARRSRPDVRVATAHAALDELEEEEERVPRQRSVTPAPQARTRQRIHPLLFVGLGLAMTVLLWTGISQAMSWGNNELNTLKYGDPRTFQLDAVVGQGDSAQHPSHFIAINLRGIVTILEFPSGDPSRARVLATTSLLSPNASQAVVTLRFIDVSHNGKPDMLVDVDGVQSVLVNDGKTFRPPTPAEQQQILNEIHQQ